MDWEYKTLEKGFWEGDIDVEMNKLGAEGWEGFGVGSSLNKSGQTVKIIYFKKEKPTYNE